ncbi:hypothetical protein Gotur_028858 [Gossypium turneri]
MSSRGKLGLSASYLCRVLSLLCILAPSTIPNKPFLEFSFGLSMGLSLGFQSEIIPWDILAKALYISKKGDFNGSDGSLTSVPKNVIDKWAFETLFVATRGIVSAFSSRDHLLSVTILHFCSVVA